VGPETVGKGRTHAHSGLRGCSSHPLQSIQHEYAARDVCDQPVKSVQEALPRDGTAGHHPHMTPPSCQLVQPQRLRQLLHAARASQVLLVGQHQQRGSRQLQEATSAQSAHHTLRSTSENAPSPPPAARAAPPPRHVAGVCQPRPPPTPVRRWPRSSCANRHAVSSDRPRPTRSACTWSRKVHVSGWSMTQGLTHSGGLEQSGRC
jgi:hypothetical protein